jgi:hypothetical protein
MSVFRGHVLKSSRRGVRISGSLPGSDSAFQSRGRHESAFPEQSDGCLARPLFDRIALHYSSTPLRMSGFTANGGRFFACLSFVAVRSPAVDTLQASENSDFGKTRLDSIRPV